MTKNPLSPLLGIEILDVDLSAPLRESDIFELKNLYNDYQLLVFRNQHLSPKNYFEFSKHFGIPTPPLSKFVLPDHPSISIMSNVKIQGEPQGVIVKELLWHSDSYVRENPNKTTLLLCIESPIDGGETFFVNTRAAYETLSFGMHEHIENKKIIYKNIDLTKPPVIHPIVRQNKFNKKKSLYVNTHNAMGIENMEQNEAMQLIGYLYDHVVQPKNIYSHQWKVGDLLVWDNPSLMHAPAPAPDTPRTLHRIIIEGELPVS